MEGILAIVVYRSIINCTDKTSLDFQVRWFSETNAETVRQSIAKESVCEYENNEGEIVRWEFVEIMAIERCSSPKSGDELIGFIAKLDELANLLK